MGHNIEARILKVYFENPNKSFTVREMSKMTQIPRSTVQKKLALLRAEKFLNKENIVEANLLFKIKKINYYTDILVSSGLIDFLINELNPSCIILFGSFRKGESDKTSDVDIFVESSVKKNLYLTNFERKLGHKIDLFVETKLNNLQENLLNNVINGIKLFGNIKLK